jgi:hypothetical protein
MLRLFYEHLILAIFDPSPVFLSPCYQYVVKKGRSQNQLLQRQSVHYQVWEHRLINYWKKRYRKVFKFYRNVLTVSLSNKVIFSQSVKFSLYFRLSQYPPEGLYTHPPHGRNIIFSNILIPKMYTERTLYEIEK